MFHIAWVCFLPSLCPSYNHMDALLLRVLGGMKEVAITEEETH